MSGQLGSSTQASEGADSDNLPDPKNLPQVLKSVFPDDLTDVTQQHQTPYNDGGGGSVASGMGSLASPFAVTPGSPQPSEGATLPLLHSQTRMAAHHPPLCAHPRRPEAYDLGMPSLVAKSTDGTAVETWWG